MSRLLDLLLSTDPAQRTRLAQTGLALLLLGAGVAAMHYFVWAGVAPLQPVLWWSLLTLAGMVVFYALIRSGWSRRLLCTWASACSLACRSVWCCRACRGFPAPWLGVV